MAQLPLSEQPLFDDRQHNPEVTFETWCRITLAYRLHPGLQSRVTVTAEPTITGADDEKVWLIPSGATGGTWSGNAGKFAIALNSAWHLRPAVPGIYYVIDDDEWWLFDGTTWTEATGI